jgi:hypothetical protein
MQAGGGMSDFQHTPGPWEYQWEDYRYVISAAPDMFAALNLVLSHWQSDYLPQGWESIRDSVRDARNKADPTGALKAMTALDDEMEQSADQCGLCGGSFSDERHIYLSGGCPMDNI